MNFTRVYGFICPHCGSEIKYDRNYYDRQIKKLADEITDIDKQLRLKKDKEEWRKKAVKASQIKREQIRDLRMYRKAANNVTNSMIDSIFRQLVKERLVESEYIKLREKAEKEAEFVSTSELMKGTSVQINAVE